MAHDASSGAAPLPRVSIVVPVFNRRHLVFDTIDSILLQGWPDLEVIVVDDASTDGTAAAVARRYGARVRIEIQPRNQGAAAARNRGLAAATGALLGTMDSDDVFAAGSIRRLASALERHPRATLAYGRYGRKPLGAPPAPAPLPSADDKDAWPDGDLLGRYLRRPFFRHTDVLFRRELLPAGGELYPREARHLEDYLAMARLLARARCVPAHTLVTWVCQAEGEPRLRNSWRTMLEETSEPIEQLAADPEVGERLRPHLPTLRARFLMSRAHAARAAGLPREFRSAMARARSLDPSVIGAGKFFRRYVASFVA